MKLLRDQFKQIEYSYNMPKKSILNPTAKTQKYDSGIININYKNFF